MYFLLKQFWEWLPIPYEEYATNGTPQLHGSYEDEFPFFSELLSYAELIVEKEFVGDEYIDDLLTIMALDNETEYVLDLIETDSSNYQFQHIVSSGITHPLYNARWQLAELIYRRQPMQYDFYLQVLSSDSHPYVQKRAMNCIERIKRES